MIIFDAKSNSGDQTTSTSYSWNHTLGANASLLVVGFSIRPSTVPTSVTCNGQAMTKIRDDNAVGSNRQTSLWYIMNPGTGTVSIACSGYSVILTNSVGFAASFSYASTIKVLDQNNGYSTTSSVTNPSANITPTYKNELLVDVLCTGIDDGVATPGTDQVITDTVACSGAHTGAMSYKILTSDSLTSMSYTTTSADVALGVGSFRASPSAGFVANKLRPAIFTPGFGR